MKANPLFFDSTKFRGDTVVVEFHIRGIELGEGELLIADLVRHDEKTRARFETQGKALVAPIRLEYQQEYLFSPLILKNDQIVEALEERKVKAQYVVHLEYQRMVLEEVAAIPVDAVALPAMNYRLPATLDLTPEAKALLRDK